MGRHVAVNTTVIGSKVQSLLEVTFLLNLFCSDTILTYLASDGNEKQEEF